MGIIIIIIIFYFSRSNLSRTYRILILLLMRVIVVYIMYLCLLYVAMGCHLKKASVVAVTNRFLIFFFFKFIKRFVSIIFDFYGLPVDRDNIGSNYTWYTY